jgi:hypothetical protein
VSAACVRCAATSKAALTSAVTAKAIGVGRWLTRISVLRLVLVLVRALLFGTGEQAVGYSPPRMSPGFASSFISLRGVPNALFTWARGWFAADQRVL